MYKILTGKYDVDITPKVLLHRVYGSTTRGNVFKLDKGRAKYDLPRNIISLKGWLMLGTVSLTMLYYLKLLTLLNHDLINFGNIKNNDFIS